MGKCFAAVAALVAAFTMPVYGQAMGTPGDWNKAIYLCLQNPQHIFKERWDSYKQELERTCDIPTESGKGFRLLTRHRHPEDPPYVQIICQLDSPNADCQNFITGERSCYTAASDGLMWMSRCP